MGFRPVGAGEKTKTSKQASPDEKAEQEEEGEKDVKQRRGERIRSRHHSVLRRGS